MLHTVKYFDQNATSLFLQPLRIELVCFAINNNNNNNKPLRIEHDNFLYTLKFNNHNSLFVQKYVKLLAFQALLKYV